MKRLFIIEYYKNLSYRPFKVFSILYFVVLIAVFFLDMADIKIGVFQINFKEQGVYNFPQIWNFTTWIIASLKILLGLIIVFSICQEFSTRMFKQNTIDGLSRKEFIASKLLTIFNFTFFSTLMVFVLTLIFGYSNSESTDVKLVFEEVFFIGQYFMKLFAFFCFLMFLSILFRKSIFVFLAFFFWWVIEIILHIIEYRAKLFGQSPDQAEKILNDSFFYSNLLPLESMSQLISNPLVRLKSIKALGAEYQYQYPTESVVACVIWCALFIFGSYWILKKRDW